jgi:hypothetical protein
MPGYDGMTRHDVLKNRKVEAARPCAQTARLRSYEAAWALRTRERVAVLMRRGWAVSRRVGVEEDRQ